jgi:hypothetical protein
MNQSKSKNTKLLGLSGMASGDTGGRFVSSYLGMVHCRSE